MNLAEKVKTTIERAEAPNGTGISEYTPQEIREFVGGLSDIIHQHAPELKLDKARLGFMSAISKNPKIKECEVSTIIGAFYQCALYELDPNEGECYFIPRSHNFGTYDNAKWEQVLNYETGYQGYLKIYEEMGYILDVRLICKADDIIQDAVFDATKGWELRYTPREKTPNKDNIRYAFVTAIYPNGLKKSDVIFIEEIEQMRKVSPSQMIKKGNNNVISQEPIKVWGKWYGEMAKKSCIRRMKKWIGQTSGKSQFPIKDEGVLLASDYNIELPSPEPESLKTVNNEKELVVSWEMTLDKAETLVKKYRETHLNENPEATKEEVTEAYLMNVELLTGHRKVKEMTEEQYNQLWSKL